MPSSLQASLRCRFIDGVEIDTHPVKVSPPSLKARFLPPWQPAWNWKPLASLRCSSSFWNDDLIHTLFPSQTTPSDAYCPNRISNSQIQSIRQSYSPISSLQLRLYFLLSLPSKSTWSLAGLSMNVAKRSLHRVQMNPQPDDCTRPFELLWWPFRRS